ncbi:MAG: hypothetical protein U0X91_20285 [Spirosomataceae bacterium]
MKITHFLLVLGLLQQLTVTGQSKKDSLLQKTDDPALRMKFEGMGKGQDSLSRKLNYAAMEATRRDMEKRIQNAKVARTNSAVQGIQWVERGPNNVGGRTRALMFDPNDPTHKKVWAGGVTGGLWYNNDITNGSSSWQKVNDFWDNISISCIVSDPSDPQVFYVGTGEYNLVSTPTYGSGIWKTTDGGATWQKLASTVPSRFPPDLNHPFLGLKKMAVNQVGHVFVSTIKGVVKSADGGASWQIVLAPKSCIGYASPCLSNYTDDAFDVEIGSDGIVYAAFGSGYIFRSADANGTAWNDVSPAGLGNSGGRTEMALAPSTNGSTQVIYAISDYGYFKKSVDAGHSWQDMQSIGYSQAWYNLTLAVHPTNPNTLYAGLVYLYKSTNAGAGWNQTLTGHADHHILLFRPENPHEFLVGNDGGVYFHTDTETTLNVQARNNNYNITQYYTVAVKNIANDGYLLGGTQDNGTNYLTSNLNTIGNGTQVLCCDGTNCFIDQNEPNIQIMSYQGGNFFLSTGQYLTTGWNGFITPADYDDVNNTLYVFKTGTYDGGNNNTLTLARVRNVGTTNNADDLVLTTYTTPFGGFYAHFMKLGLSRNSIYIDVITPTSGNRLFKISTINQPTQTVVTDIDNGTFPNGISCLDFGENENQLLATVSHYDTESVWYSADGGTTWISKDKPNDGLPNMPVYSGVFNPRNRKQVFLATEYGVWSTDDITAENPEWQLTSLNLARTRCFMLKVRAADNVLTVATHGRGIFQANMPDGECPPDFVVNEPITSTFKKQYKAARSVKGESTIGSSSDVTFKAGQSVELNPGFESKLGSVFYAYISGCNENTANAVFNGKVDITYDLLHAASVSLDIFNLQNKKVATLLQHQKQNIGFHKITWETQDIPEGDYLYILNVDNLKRTGRISLDKKKRKF